MNNYQCCITANISASEVIEKISKVTGWWGVTLEGSTEKQMDGFTIKMGADSFFNFTVAELVSGKRLVWAVSECNMPWYANKKEWSNSRLIFEVNEQNGTTNVKFTHDGLTPDLECYKDCEPGWTHWIKESLFSYLTTGKGVFRAPTK